MSEPEEYLITVPWQDAAALEALADSLGLAGGWEILEALATAVESGWRRPGSWERSWLGQAFPLDLDAMPADYSTPHDCYGEPEENAGVRQAASDDDGDGDGDDGAWSTVAAGETKGSALRAAQGIAHGRLPSRVGDVEGWTGVVGGQAVQLRWIGGPGSRVPVAPGRPIGWWGIQSRLLPAGRAWSPDDRGLCRNCKRAPTVHGAGGRCPDAEQS